MKNREGLRQYKHMYVHEPLYSTSQKNVSKTVYRFPVPFSIRSLKTERKRKHRRYHFPVSLFAVSRSSVYSRIRTYVHILCARELRAASDVRVRRVSCELTYNIPALHSAGYSKAQRCCGQPSELTKII